MYTLFLLKSWDTLLLSHGKLLFKSLGCLNNGAILHFELPWVARMMLHVKFSVSRGDLALKSLEGLMI